ncbi:MAG: hypothetical protein R3F24_14835 [Gammaproteobacteria bacterium]
MYYLDGGSRSALEGPDGRLCGCSYWGVYDVDRQAKFAFKAAIVRIPEWRILAGIAVGLALILLLAFSVDNRNLPTWDVVQGAAYATPPAWSGSFMSTPWQYVTVTTVLVGLLLVFGSVGVIAVVLAEAHEWAGAQWAVGVGVLCTLQCRPAAWQTPKVSIHLPFLLQRTARDGYPDPGCTGATRLSGLWRLVVADNNTRRISLATT